MGKIRGISLDSAVVIRGADNIGTCVMRTNLLTQDP